MKRFAQSISVAASLLVIAGSMYGITHRQEIFDYFALRNYTPSTRIVSLADDTTMQDGTRRVFYVNHPELNTKEDFQNNCPVSERNNEHSIVLGCYIERKGIFLQDVTDERLNGVIQVTAAHEVLHAEYDRLSKSERERIDRLTKDFFAQLPDERIKQTIERYRSNDPSVVPNELHSIIGTEVRDLTPELESYYGRYFKDRGSVVAFSEKYEQTFTTLRNQVDQYDKQLAEMKETIEANQVELEKLGSDIEQQKNRLDSLINAGRTQEYNQAVPGFNATVGRYNALLNTTRAIIEEYNSIVSKRNAIVVTEQELVQAIDANALPRQTQ